MKWVFFASESEKHHGQSNNGISDPVPSLGERAAVSFAHDSAVS